MKLNLLKSSKNNFLKVCFKATLLFVLILSVITTSLSFVYDSKYKAGNVVFAPTIVYTFAGTGTSSNPYQIKSATDLKNLATNVNNGRTYSGKYFKLTTNINLNYVSFTPIGISNEKYFAGTFDGDNHIIEGLYVDVTTTYAGLFGYINEATIKNLIVDGWVMAGNDCYTGGIVGYAFGDVSFYNCTNKCGLGGGSYAGGIIGGLCGKAKFLLCRNLGDISSSYCAGGICGFADFDNHNYNCGGDFEKCFNSGNVSAHSDSNQEVYAAGIMCSTSSLAFNYYYCYNTGTVSADTSKSYSHTEYYTLDEQYYYNSKNKKKIYRKIKSEDYIEKYDEATLAYAEGIGLGSYYQGIYNIGYVWSGGYITKFWQFDLRAHRTVKKSTCKSIKYTFSFVYINYFAYPITRATCSFCDVFSDNDLTYEEGQYYMSDTSTKIYSINFSDAIKNTYDINLNLSNNAEDFATDYFVVSKAANSNDLTFYISDLKDLSNDHKVCLLDMGDSYSINQNSEYKFAFQDRDIINTKVNDIKSESYFYDNEVWGTNNPAINNGYPYIKEMYW